jgi:flavin reductase (DIM6/NTAB) family NADH-FMN oxidoreductase RutF
MKFDMAELKVAERYKLIAGLIVPRPIALVSTVSPDGKANAAPYSFFNAFAEEPPIVILGLGRNTQGAAKDTTNNIRDTGEFVVNLVDEGIAEAMNVTSIDFPPEISEIEVAGFTLAASEKVAPGRIREAPVSLECRRYVTLQPGQDRYIALGEVLMIHARDGIVDPSNLRVDRDVYRPIGRLFGGGYCYTNDRFEMPRGTYEAWKRERTA